MAPSAASDVLMTTVIEGLVQGGESRDSSDETTRTSMVQAVEAYRGLTIALGEDVSEQMRMHNDSLDEEASSNMDDTLTRTTSPLHNDVIPEVFVKFRTDVLNSQSNDAPDHSSTRVNRLAVKGPVKEELQANLRAQGELVDEMEAYEAEGRSRTPEQRERLGGLARRFDELSENLFWKQRRP